MVGSSLVNTQLAIAARVALRWRRVRAYSWPRAHAGWDGIERRLGRARERYFVGV